MTKELSLVPLPAKITVNEILDAYKKEEQETRRVGSAEADILEEVISGLREYFDVTLGRILLYRFEREQYLETRRDWEAGKGDFEGKNGPADVYGAEHLSRLLGKSFAVMQYVSYKFGLLCLFGVQSRCRSSLLKRTWIRRLSTVCARS